MRIAPHALTAVAALSVALFAGRAYQPAQAEVVPPPSAAQMAAMEANALATASAPAGLTAPEAVPVQIRRGETKGADRVLANLCLGMAASELGLWDDARAAFAAAQSETPESETRTRARFAALAGNAALAGGDAARAEGLLAFAETDARTAKAAPLEAIAATDRGRALVMLGRNEDALAALETATTRAPERSEGWLLKATLLRRLERLGEAQTAIERAATLTPDNPEIGLEAGLIAVLGSRDDAARTSWRSVLVLAPDSPAAATARDYLAQLGDTVEVAPTLTPHAPQQAQQEQPR
jgi:tetratricopeptide (TPR) repeat protein